MVNLNQAKQTQVGEDQPTDASKKAVDDIVNDVVDDVLPKEEQAEQKEADLGKQEESETQEESEESTEDTEESEADESDKDEEEDLIPKSKVQERIDKLTAKIKSLESENSKLTSKKPESNDEKLERLNLDELKQLRRQAKLAARTEQDESKLEQLIDLEEKVEDKISNFPQRFQQRQINNLQSVLPDFAKIDPNVVNMKGDLWNIASSIYQRSSALKSSDMGQVEAMLLAAEHLNLKRSNTSSKADTSTLSRQVNNLKKKTSLEGKTRVQGDRGINLTKLREKAKTGDIIDKENFFKEVLVPDDFLQI